MRLDLALAVLGFLIGNLVGMSATSVVAPLLGLLFAFGGGSAIALFEKLDAPARRQAAQCILSLSLGCLAGVYAGIVVTERQLLTPRDPQTGLPMQLAGRHAYVRSEVVAVADSIDYQRRQKIITGDQAFELLLETVKKGAAER